MTKLWRVLLACVAIQFAAVLVLAAAHASIQEPTSLEEAREIAAEMGYGESCGDRCWNCSTSGCECGTDECVCPFANCLGNCAGGHHPVCCYGCDSDPPPPDPEVGELCPDGYDPPIKRDYDKVLEKVLELLADGDPDNLLKTCSDRCDGTGCHTCHNSAQCNSDRCCGPLDCFSNCIENHHPVCCWGC